MIKVYGYEINNEEKNYLNFELKKHKKKLKH